MSNGTTEREKQARLRDEILQSWKGDTPPDAFVAHVAAGLELRGVGRAKALEIALTTVEFQ